jgi:hypothetical protein
VPADRRKNEILEKYNRVFKQLLSSITAPDHLQFRENRRGVFLLLAAVDIGSRNVNLIWDCIWHANSCLKSGGKPREEK